MSKVQKYLSVGIGVLVIGLLIWQYISWQTQVNRHEQALAFWQTEVPKIQEQYPEFHPQNMDEALARESEMFLTQKKMIQLNCGLIVVGGLAGLGLVYFIPRRLNSKKSV